MDAALDTPERAEALAMENAHLRVMAASVRCPYGHRDVGGVCELGYPGCSCMDDLMAITAWCPEDEEKVAVRLGARLADAESQFNVAARHIDETIETLKQLSTRLRYHLLAE